jgi:hypothetical protein
MTVFTGFFIGVVELIAIVVTGLVVAPDDIGVAQGFFASFRNTGGTIASMLLPLRHPCMGFLWVPISKIVLTCLLQ